MKKENERKTKEIKIEENLNFKQKQSNYFVFIIYDKYTNKFLTYYDEEWDCYFLCNEKMKGFTDYQETYKLLKKLNISNSRLYNLIDLGSCVFTKEKLPEKYMKKYMHCYRQVLIHNYGEEETGKNYGRNGIQYRWMTLDEMVNDENIYKKNKDVIGHLVEFLNEDNFVI